MWSLPIILARARWSASPTLAFHAEFVSDAIPVRPALNNAEDSFITRATQIAMTANAKMLHLLYSDHPCSLFVIDINYVF